MMYIKLYLAFVQIGILSFGGGYAALPTIQKVIVEHNAWISNTTMLDIISISQMTPGPIAINAATFVGMSLLGLSGAIVATVGVVTPQIIILTIFLKFIGFKNRYFSMMLDGLNVAIIALILITTISLIKSSIIDSFSKLNLGIFIFGAYFYYKNYSMIKLIIISGIIGLLGVIIGA